MSNRLFIEKIGSEEALMAAATVDDRAAVECFANARRRCEVLAWRAIVRRELGEGVTISHDEYGAPEVSVSDTCISVSHSREHVAVLLSEIACAVDIECVDRDFRRVANHYLSDAEQRLAEQYDIYAEMWTAKEALYKYYKKGGIDFIRDVKISEFHPEQGLIVATIFGGKPIEVHIKREGNLSIALI
jgi:phosphopantetheinyl transferase